MAASAAPRLAAALLAAGAAGMEAEPGGGAAYQGSAAASGLPGAGGAVALAGVSILGVTALWLLALRVGPAKRRGGSGSGSAGGGPHTPERLQVFARWAQQQIEESKAEAHRQMLDDVIFTFATYAQRLEQEPCRAARRAAALRLRVLAELLETPSVHRALRAANWAWLREWDQHLLDPREARLRLTAVFPTICAAAKVQRIERMKFAAPGLAGAGGCAPSLAYLAGWCADFLERPDARALLDLPAVGTGGCGGGSSPMGGQESGSFMADGSSYSDSSEDEDAQCPSPVGSRSPVSQRASSFSGLGSRGSVGSEERCEAAGSDFFEFPRRRYDGEEHCWDRPDATQAMVRGERYLTDQRKVRSRPDMLELVACDLVRASEEMVHYAGNAKGRVPQLRQAGDSRFFVVVNFRLHPLHFAITWAVPKDADWLEKPEGILFRRFREMSDEERNKRVKVLPKVVEGPWLVKKSMPERPGVVGKKLAVQYFMHQDHLEISINCISSPAGRRLVQILTGAARHFSLELFVMLEGQSQDELPERILGCLSVYHVDLARIPTR